MLDGAPAGGLGERLLALRGFSLLSGLPASDLALVARLARERDLHAGELLAVEGEPVHSVQLIISGGVTLSRAGARSYDAGALDTVGLLPLAAGIPHSSTAVVASDALHALELDAELVADVLEDDFALFAGTLQLGARQALAASRQPVALVSRDAGSEHGTILKGSPHPSPAPLDAAERLLALRAVAPFRAVPVDALAALVKRLELVRLQPGAELRTQPGARELLVLVTGRARVDGAGDSDSAALGLLEALADQSPDLHLRALSPVQLLRGTVSDLFDVLEDHHAMGRRLLAEMLRRTA